MTARPRGLGWWVGGTLVAFSGVGLVRLVAPRAGDLAIPAYLGGFTLAILGLFLITLGTRERG